MTMATVVRNYLRWFELNKCMRSLSDLPARHFVPPSLDGMDGSAAEPASAGSMESVDFADSLAFRKSKARKSRSNTTQEFSEDEPRQTAPMLESDF
jgi:hypothetical protein